ncbi:twin-arginine translocase subunit TatC [Flavobacterium sp. DG1-102-2]|uniref:twin-arginine translocase subunit TatC n=1 Tax=Flavobacterium sp. DG1-102-2 TaxID=3081663 RepID=UPI0029497B77|nr:twin-arginine translocase subunit TatC [Flavobacterium sp. DG1-102-2]MDV6168408.1 twin-arginine translocase subunit TatC [Flavobacterium sp. DG1-102-2]
MAKKKTPAGEMSFLDHLEELRWLLVRSCIAICIGGCVAFTFSQFIFDEIIFAPTRGNFITYRFFCDLANKYDLDKSFCIDKLPFEIQSRSMDGQFSTDIWTAITAGFILAAPFMLWEIWKFISPALYDKEKKYAAAFIFSTSLLFFMGVVFGHYLITPLSLNFLGNYRISDVVKNDIDLDSYLSLIKTTAISCGLVFELPIIMYFLSKLGIISAKFLRNYRRYAYVIILIIAAVVTPPDVVSQMIVTIPIAILFETSIFIAARIDKQKAKKEKLEANV